MGTGRRAGVRRGRRRACRHCPRRHALTRTACRPLIASGSGTCDELAYRPRPAPPAARGDRRETRWTGPGCAAPHDRKVRVGSGASPTGIRASTSAAPRRAVARPFAHQLGGDSGAEVDARRRAARAALKPWSGPHGRRRRGRPRPTSRVGQRVRIDARSSGPAAGNDSRPEPPGRHLRRQPHPAVRIAGSTGPDRHADRFRAEAVERRFNPPEQPISTNLANPDRRATAARGPSAAPTTSLVAWLSQPAASPPWWSTSPPPGAEAGRRPRRRRGASPPHLGSDAHSGADRISRPVRGADQPQRSGLPQAQRPLRTTDATDPRRTSTAVIHGRAGEARIVARAACLLEALLP